MGKGPAVNVCFRDGPRSLLLPEEGAGAQSEKLEEGVPEDRSHQDLGREPGVERETPRDPSIEGREEEVSFADRVEQVALRRSRRSTAVSFIGGSRANARFALPRSGSFPRLIITKENRDR